MLQHTCVIAKCWKCSTEKQTQHDVNVLAGVYKLPTTWGCQNLTGEISVNCTELLWILVAVLSWNHSACWGHSCSPCFIAEIPFWCAVVTQIVPPFHWVKGELPLTDIDIWLTFAWYTNYSKMPCELGLQLADALNCGRHVVRIAFAQNSTKRNVSLQELHSVEPGRHTVHFYSF